MVPGHSPGTARDGDAVVAPGWGCPAMGTLGGRGPRAALPPPDLVVTRGAPGTGARRHRPDGRRARTRTPRPEGRTYLSDHRCLGSGRPDGGVPAGWGHGRARTDTDGHRTPPRHPAHPRGGPPRPRPRRSHKWRGAAAAAALARPGDPPCGSQLAQVPRKVEPGPGRGGGDGLTLGRPPCPAPHPRGRPAGAAALSEPPLRPGGDAGTPPGWERSGGSERAEPPPLHPALPALRGAEAAPAHPRARGGSVPAGRARARLSPGRRFLPLGGHFYSRGRPAPGPPSGPLTGCRTPEPRT
ncbi:basic salivary proline-rich protein 3-like [Melospiza melodia melodia]|uniref:basic salivary proline-rich protein 3-like n=1 Tax=Melospiza melodia melodia TaxID=1914991 RepID=UPI002FD2692E